MDLVNLHVHSQWSDGRLAANQVMRQAAGLGVNSVVALTDHDSLGGLEPFFRTAERLKSKNGKAPRPLGGVELSCYCQEIRSTVHLVGLFPLADPGDFGRVLKRASDVLGTHCARMCAMRGRFDLEERLALAFRLNLDGLARRLGSFEEAKMIALSGLSARRERLYAADEKQDDLILMPAPATYQDLIDAWPDLIPGSSRRKIGLYLLRPHGDRVRQLARIMVEEDGFKADEAQARALDLQGCLAMPAIEPAELPTPLKSLALLHEAGAVSVLAHPAVERHRLTFRDFDEAVTLPLIESGLMALEVFYPYDLAYRREATEHYLRLTREHGLLVSGGSDYHGDARGGLDSLPLTYRDLEPLLIRLGVE